MDICGQSNYPFKIEKAIAYDEKFKDHFKDLYLIGPKSYCFNRGYVENAHHFYNFEVRPDDVWITGFPRSGTTMCEELVWLLCNNLDYEKAAAVVSAERFPFFEMASYPSETKSKILEWLKLEDRNKVDFKTMEGKPNHIKLAEQKGRRFIKAHSPFSLLPPNLVSSGCKIIYVARNPKDVAVSCYHALDLLISEGLKLNIEEFFEVFYKGYEMFAPQVEHVKEGWKLRHNKNVMFVFYEDLRKDLRNNIKRFAEFLEKDLTDAQIDDLVTHLQIDNFRKNKSVNNEYLSERGLTNKKKEHDFIRKGKVGGWKDYISEDLAKEADQWFSKQLEGTDLVFPE